MRKDGPIWALGAMSGTSLDGVDAAMVQTDGITIHGFGPSAYRAYTAEEQDTIRAALGQWPDDAGVAAAAEVVENAHAELLARFAGAEILGFHGQTLAHDPSGRGTHQCGNGALLAEALGLTTVWDFRSCDVTMGGQGAPLAPFFHFACARHIGATEPLAFLNLGGVGNITWVNPQAAGPEAPDALLAFDTGPANAPLNDLILQRRGLAFDQDGSLASGGEVDDAFLSVVLKDGWFDIPPPKSLDRNDFNGLVEGVETLADADAAATLTAIIAATVATAQIHFPAPVSRILVTGGGRHNPVLMAELRRRLACAVDPVEAVGLDGDMLEAQAFAYLAVRVIRKLPTSSPATTGAPTLVGGGQISRPDQPA
ncbi:anhydro-N-acetylmuramic acid kinase [Tabrizicola sp.]|uniref:anhydro-N-acetylmuramic acid kinase n=1 Tax=Tabrizicola sp. TaxID=2005166 RepID=UPI00261A6BA1|nr:anhydro-N-acetylmuramic acid kinase [Tabrizicola sp.]MDM7931156.1 anhydro-N-acetylmuramic acid kinase [Tabrizicola sp.]